MQFELEHTFMHIEKVIVVTTFHLSDNEEVTRHFVLHSSIAGGSDTNSGKFIKSVPAKLYRPSLLLYWHFKLLVGPIGYN